MYLEGECMGKGVCGAIDDTRWPGANQGGWGRGGGVALNLREGRGKAGCQNLHVRDFNMLPTFRGGGI